MSKGVDLHKIEVSDDGDGRVTLEVTLTVTADHEMDAIGWLVEVLGAEA